MSREQAYATSKTFHTHAESTSAEVRRIWERWNAGGVSACQYCGAPMITHNTRDCLNAQARIEEEANA